MTTALQVLGAIAFSAVALAVFGLCVLWLITQRAFGRTLQRDGEQCRICGELARPRSSNPFIIANTKDGSWLSEIYMLVVCTGCFESDLNGLSAYQDGSMIRALTQPEPKMPVFGPSTRRRMRLVGLSPKRGVWYGR